MTNRVSKRAGGRTYHAPVFAVGDIHGCLEPFLLLIKKIERELCACRGRKRPQLVFLGDYGDRGKDTKKVVDHLIDLYLEKTCLLGNHDFVFRNFLNASDPDTLVDIANAWMGSKKSGARETALSYGVPESVLEGLDPIEKAPGEKIVAFQKKLVSLVPLLHRLFFEELKPMHEEGPYIFAHAGIRPDVPLKRQSLFDLLCIRRDFLDSASDFGDRIVVHGHTPTADNFPVIRPHRIGIDTRPYRTGQLACVALKNDQHPRLIYATSPSLVLQRCNAA